MLCQITREYAWRMTEQLASASPSAWHRESYIFFKFAPLDRSGSTEPTMAPTFMSCHFIGDCRHQAGARD